MLQQIWMLKLAFKNSYSHRIAVTEIVQVVQLDVQIIYLLFYWLWLKLNSLANWNGNFLSSFILLK